jgi:hypothetical protein
MIRTMIYYTFERLSTKKWRFSENN